MRLQSRPVVYERQTWPNHLPTSDLGRSSSGQNHGWSVTNKLCLFPSAYSLIPSFSSHMIFHPIWQTTVRRSAGWAVTNMHCQSKVGCWPRIRWGGLRWKALDGPQLACEPTVPIKWVRQDQNIPLVRESYSLWKTMPLGRMDVYTSTITPGHIGV